MATDGSFFFGGYALIPATGEHLPLARAWNEADPDHHIRVKAAWWVEQDRGQDAYLLLDKAREPVFFFKVTRGKQLDTLWIHIQFPPGDSLKRRAESMRGMEAGLKWLEAAARGVGVRKICFDSRSPSLILFCQKRLGFTVIGERLEKVIEAAP